MLAKSKLKMSQKFSVILFSFAYALLSIQIAKADDIDVYTRAINFGTGGEPVMTFVIDTSGSMAWGMSNNNSPSTIFDERMFQLQNALHDQLTAMKGTFSVGLFSYDAGNKSGTLEKAAKPLSLIETSNVGATVSSGGTFNQDTVHDVAWIVSAAARDGENILSIPYTVNPGGRNSLGDTVQGKWQSSGGQDRNPANGTYDYAGLVAGNKLIKYYASSNSNQKFWLERSGGGSVPDPYLFILNSSGTLVASNDDESAATATCPSGWVYNGGSVAGQCHRSVAVNCTSSGWGGQTCDYVDEYQAPTITGGNINSYISLNLTSGQEYIIVAGTKSPGQAGNFTLRITNGTRGYFFENSAPSSDPQNTAFRFNNVNIPKGATINNAYLVFRADTAGYSHSLDVRVDQSLTPVALQGNDIDGGRSWFAQPSKFIASVNANNDFQVNVTSLVAAKLNQAEWCGGEDMVFMIEGETPTYHLSGLQFVIDEPFNVRADETSDEPRLYVNWSHSGGSSCYSKTVNVKTASIGDDIRQAPNGVISRQETQINIGAGNKAGLRFGFMSLPNAVDGGGTAIGLNVKEAYLNLTASSNSNPGTIYIRAIQEGLAQPFSSDNYELDDRELGATIAWNINQWQAGTVYKSPNLSSIIQTLLEQDNWEYQGTIGLIVSAASNETTKFYTFEERNGNSNQRSGASIYNWANLGTLAPSLTITASANKPFESGDAYRKDLFDELMGSDFIPDNGTPIAGSYVEAAEYMLGKGSYDSPLDVVGVCQSNTLVLLTDGDDTAWGGNESDFENISGTNCSGNWDCSYDLAEALKNGVPWYDPIVLAGDDGRRVLKTYTIGYGPIATDVNAKTRLTNVANYGDGKFYEASDATKLAKAFESIIGSISDSGASISVPGVAVSAFNRITLLDEVYYSLFKPSTRRNWQGNAKRYRLHNDAIVDVNGNDAVNLSSTYFEDLAQSWWSPTADGPVVYVGGASANITPQNRKLYTYKGANGSSLGASTGAMSSRGLDLGSSGLNITTNGSSLTPEDLGMSFLGALPPSQVNARKAKIVEWLQGGTVDNPRKEIGAPLHSSPVMIGYKQDGTELVSTIFVSTNEGYLHAIDTGEPTRGNAAQDRANRGGKELFAFIPKETMLMAAALEENAVVDFTDPNYEHAYGLDSTWTFWREGGSDTTINAPSDHVYIYGGMRRGGKMIYGLNVTSAYYGGDVEPKLLFAVGNSIVSGPTPVSGSPSGNVNNYQDIGQTWSVPRVREILWKGSIRTVLLFGGGYDEQHDNPNFEGTNELGSQVYMLDAATGDMLWAMSTPSSIVSRLRPYDRTGDSLIDSFYAVDLQGRILRFDLNAAGNDFVMHQIANLGGSGTQNRKFYAEPSIALFQNTLTNQVDVMIAVGSGYRALPTNKTVQEQFYMVFDRGAYSANATPPNHLIQGTNLTTLVIDVDTVTGLSKDPTDPAGIYQIDGWKVNFDKSIGEKALGAPLIFNGLVTFTTYTHEESGSTTCTPVIGQTRLYIMDIAGKGRADIFNGSGSFIEDVSPGLASDVQIVTIDGQPVILNDKAIVKPDPAKVCDLINCNGRDLDRSSWTSRSMAADDNPLEGI